MMKFEITYMDKMKKQIEIELRDEETHVDGFKTASGIAGYIYKDAEIKSIKRADND